MDKNMNMYLLAEAQLSLVEAETSSADPWTAKKKRIAARKAKADIYYLTNWLNCHEK